MKSHSYAIVDHWAMLAQPNDLSMIYAQWSVLSFMGYAMAFVFISLFVFSLYFFASF